MADSPMELDYSDEYISDNNKEQTSPLKSSEGNKRRRDVTPRKYRSDRKEPSPVRKHRRISPPRRSPSSSVDRSTRRRSRSSSTRSSSSVGRSSSRQKKSKPVRSRGGRSPSESSGGSQSPVRERRRWNGRSSKENSPRTGRERWSPRHHSPQRRRRFSRSPSPGARDRQDSMWQKRRQRREDIQKRGVTVVWADSPSHSEIEQAYKLREEADRIREENEKKGEKLKASREKAKKLEKKMKNLDVSNNDSEESSSEEEKKKRKKSKKEKKHKKEKKSKKEKKIKKKAESSDEWEERPAEEEKERDPGDASPGPALPEHLKVKLELANRIDPSIRYGKDLLRGEGESMAAYIARGERIPRRGEIGLSSNEIDKFEQWGYVMSGSRHKAMEATRIRKENQILTAEEKRLLSGVSQEAKKKREQEVLDNFKALIKNKNIRS